MELKFSEGTEHDVFLEGNTIIKIPKVFSDFEKAKARIEEAQKMFGDYILDTIIEPGNNGYILKQDFIDGEPVNINNIDFIRDDLLELLKLHSSSIKNTGKGIDFIGLEGTIKSFLFILSKISKGTIMDKHIVTPFFTKLEGSNYYFGRLLKFWNDNPLPELANIMIDENGKIKVIDLSSTGINEVGIYGKSRALALEFYNQIYFYLVFKIIYK